MATSQFAAAAQRLRQVQDRIPADLQVFMRSAQRSIETGAAARIRPGARPHSVGIYSVGPTVTASGKVEVEFYPRYIARWQEGGTKSHTIGRSDRTRQRSAKAAMRASRRAARSRGKVETMLTTGYDEKGNTLSARRRAGLQKRRASAMTREAAGTERARRILTGEEYLGPLAIGKGRHGTVTAAAKPHSNFAAHVQHPGERPRKPLRREIAQQTPKLAPKLAGQVNRSWTQVIT